MTAVLPRLADFGFVWPAMLGLLSLLPLAAIGYGRLLARWRRLGQRQAGLISAAGPVSGRAGWSRHMPAALIWLGAGMLLAAAARPQALIVLPKRTQTVMLAMDVSGSMRATDIKPSRIVAAQRVARAFIDDLPANARIGIVAIAGTAAVVQSPTRERDQLSQAIDRFQLQRGTALGSGIVIALTTLLPEARLDADQLILGTGPRPEPGPAPDSGPSQSAAPAVKDSVAIVLLTDGESNTGPDVIEMAKLAARYGVRVYTVGMGTPAGATLSANGWSMRVRVDEVTLKAVADITHAEYFHADSARELSRVYRELGARLTLDKAQTTELSAPFATMGMLLALLGVLPSIGRYQRVL